MTGGSGNDKVLVVMTNKVNERMDSCLRRNDKGGVGSWELEAGIPMFPDVKPPRQVRGRRD